MKVSLFYLPSIGNRAQIEQGMVGLRGELYDQMLSELSAQAKLADALGYDSISFTEHHFHAEGFEISNNPVLLDLYVGMQTKRIRVGQLGIVLPANNPIRVAEDIAMLDHMTGGRANAGFARGYQRRWVDIMAQQTHGIHGAQPHQHDAIDDANRAAFEECYQIIKEGLDRRYAQLRRQVLAGSTGRDAVDDRGDAEVGQGGRKRYRQGRQRRAEAGAEAPSAGVPALRVIRTQYPLVRRRERDRGAAAVVPGV